MTTDDFTTAARAEAERRSIPIPVAPGDLSLYNTCLVSMAWWARDHLAAERTSRARRTGLCPTCAGDVHVDMAGDIWTTTNGPTEAEIEAAAMALYALDWTDRWADQTEAEHDRYRGDARDALTAARTARRGER